MCPQRREYLNIQEKVKEEHPGQGSKEKRFYSRHNESFERGNLPRSGSFPHDHDSPQASRLVPIFGCHKPAKSGKLRPILTNSATTLGLERRIFAQIAATFGICFLGR